MPWAEVGAATRGSRLLRWYGLAFAACCAHRGARAQAGIQSEDTCSFPALFTPSVVSPDLCITSTITVTSTTSTITTRRSTTTSTTTPQPRECRSLCEPNGHPWFIKCGWAVCATCSQCANVVVPTSEQPIESNFSFLSTSTTTFNSGNTKPSTTTASRSTTSTSTKTSTPGTTMDFKQTSTTSVGVSTVPIYSCLSGCYSYPGVTWADKCTWAICYSCKECEITSTTTSTTSTQTSTTSTITTSTTTWTVTINGTSTTGTTTSSTSTSRTRTTSVTRTGSSTTMTSTTTNRACDTPGSYFPTRDCQAPIRAGTTCSARSLDHVCVIPGNLTFSCPEFNIEQREAKLDSGNYSVRCRICGMANANLTDDDPRPGYFSAGLSFGPNTLDGEPNEGVVLGYFVYFADGCSRKLGRPLAYVPKVGVQPTDCCEADVYKVDINARLPSVPVNTSVVLMVVPNTSTAGELSVGLTTEELVDNATAPVKTTRTPPTVVPVMSAAHLPGAARLAVLLGLLTGSLRALR